MKAFARLQYRVNRTAVAQRRTAVKAKKAANYFAFGRQQDGEQRGVWHGPDGQVFSHEEVLTWTKSQAVQHEFTFQAVLSISDGRLSADDYSRVMAAGGAVLDWRLISHDDTAHSHAHVLFFRDKPFSKSSYLEWHGRVCEALASMQPLVMDQAVSARNEPATHLGLE